MKNQSPVVFFDKEHAERYDERFAKLAPMRDALYFLIGNVFAELRADARILCVGAGTGLEAIYLAAKFPNWHFTLVEPSAPMLDVCRRRTEEAGIASRCVYHEGYLDSLPETEPFDAATSLLVSHFILSKEARTTFFREIAERLLPGGFLVNADLASDTSAETFSRLFEFWFRLMKGADISPEEVEKFRIAYQKDVAILPPQEVGNIIATGGFTSPVLFHQTGLIHGWYSQRS